jgi:hypothetical protein
MPVESTSYFKCILVTGDISDERVSRLKILENVLKCPETFYVQNSYDVFACFCGLSGGILQAQAWYLQSRKLAIASCINQSTTRIKNGAQ